MFSLDRWMEVFDTIGRNKLRTALTAISVAWGIFVMVVLLGLGRGADNGLRFKFRREASNSVMVVVGKTSVPYGGYDIGRRFLFDNRDYERAKALPGIDRISGQYFIRGGQFGGGAMMTRRGTKANVFNVKAVHADALRLGVSEIVEGRFLDDADIAQKTKVCVIGEPVRDFLFGTEDPIGQWIVVVGVPFEVVGVLRDPGGDQQSRQIYLPVSTAQLAFHGNDHLGMLSFTVGDATAARAKDIIHDVIAQLSARHQFSPDDPQAVHVHDNVEGYERFSQVFFMMSVFVIVIGLGTLAAGVVGVSNIMMIAVKERTKEIGVRKAIGATPLSIIVMITQEAVFLTGVAGLLGLAAGVGLLGVLGSAIQTDFIRDPSIDFRIGIAATLGLVLAGALAGYFPARAAARVNPIHALRDQ
jgi:putative ABC transport system permease protein